MSSNIDYTYSLGLLKRFNNFIEFDSSLSEKFSGDINFLQCFQGSLFNDIKLWSKDKSILTSPSHHFLFFKVFFTSIFLIIVSVFFVSYIAILRRSVLIFTNDKVGIRSDHDFRLDALYKVLKEKDIDFIEVVHTVPGRETFKNLFRRKRPVFYNEIFDSLTFFPVTLLKIKLNPYVNKINLSAFSEAERPFVKFLLEKYITSTTIFRWRLKFYERFIKVSGVRQVFAIDDTRHYNELMIAGRRSGREVYAIQHGHFTKYHVGWLKMTNLQGEYAKPTLLVWSEYWKDELLRLNTIFPASNIQVGGLNEIKTIAGKKNNFKSNVILIPYETDAPKDEVRQFILNMTKLEDTEIIFKLRPDISKHTQLAEYGLLEFLGQLTVERILDETTLSRITMSVGTYSTILYDFVAQLKPVAILQTMLDYGEGMITNGLAERITPSEDLAKALDRVSGMSMDILMERKAKLEGQNPTLLSRTLESIIKNYDERN